MVLLRLLPDQISRYWDVVRYALAVSHPPTIRITDRYFVKCLEMMLAGRMQCWVVLRNLQDKRIYAVLATEIVKHYISGEKTLLVFAGTTFEVEVNMKEWRGNLLKLMKFGKANGCSTLSSFVSNPRLMELYKQIGLKEIASYTEVDLNKPL
jgi:hypothetical protein